MFDRPADASVRKVVGFIHEHHKALIEASPFVILPTSGPDGLDASPRRDPPGFVIVQDHNTLLLPERRGNNRIDSLTHLLSDPRVALLFMIPGKGEALRVNGRARISVDPGLLDICAMDGKPAKCVLIIDVESAFFQCARAILRSQLWSVREPSSRAELPSAGAMLAALTNNGIDGAAYDAELPARQQSTLY